MENVESMPIFSIIIILQHPIYIRNNGRRVAPACAYGTASRCGIYTHLVDQRQIGGDCLAKRFVSREISRRDRLESYDRQWRLCHASRCRIAADPDECIGIALFRNSDRGTKQISDSDCVSFKRKSIRIVIFEQPGCGQREQYRKSHRCQGRNGNHYRKDLQWQERHLCGNLQIGCSRFGFVGFKRNRQCAADDQCEVRTDFIFRLEQCMRAFCSHTDYA